MRERNEVFGMPQKTFVRSIEALQEAVQTGEDPALALKRALNGRTARVEAFRARQRRAVSK